MPDDKPENYWEERELARIEALKMAANLSAREKGLIVRVTKRRLINEVVHDQTRQRSFEREFLSLDYAGEEGLPKQLSNGFRDQRRMLQDMDAPQWEKIQDRRFRRALSLLKNNPTLQKTLRAIRRFYVREKIISALGITSKIYDWRLFQLRKILKIST